MLTSEGASLSVLTSCLQGNMLKPPQGFHVPMI